MVLTEKQLLEKKNEIQQAKTKLSELKGSEKTLLKQLKEDWNCTTLAEAKKKIITLEKQIESIQDEIEEKTNLLEKSYVNNEKQND